MKHLTEHELFIINKSTMKNKWCNNLVSKANLLKGRDKSTLELYENAIDTLVEKGILCISSAEGRNCYCLKERHIKAILSALLENVGKYKFICYKSIENIHKRMEIVE